MLARAGRHEEALACLEVALCRLEPQGANARLRVIDRGARATYGELASVLHKDTEGWARAAEWFEAVAARVAGWEQAGRLPAQLVREILPVLALRLHEHGRVEQARELLAQATASAQGRPAELMWVRDVARLTGHGEQADAIEADLLARRCLPVQAIAGVVDRLAGSQGCEAALAAAREAAKYTLQPDLLDRLIRLEEQLGNAEAAAEWARCKAEAAAAQSAPSAPRRVPPVRRPGR
jgi:hypothetical protein